METLKNRIQTLIVEKEKANLTTFKPTLEFFKHIGIGRKRFQKIVRSEVSLTFAEMHSLADYFGVHIWELHESTMSLAE